MGSGLLVTPVLDEGVTSVSAYFPKDTWYDYYSGAPVSQVGHMTLNIPIDEIKAHVRGGLIIPTQQPAYTLRDTRLLPFTLLIALDKQV